MNADDLAEPWSMAQPAGGPVGRCGPADDLDLHPRHAFRPTGWSSASWGVPDPPFRGRRVVAVLVLFRDALLVITLGPRACCSSCLTCTSSRGAADHGAARFVRCCSGRWCVKIVRDPMRIHRRSACSASCSSRRRSSTSSPRSTGWRRADQAYLGDLPSALISSENLAVARPLFWLSLWLFRADGRGHVRPGGHADPRSRRLRRTSPAGPPDECVGHRGDDREREGLCVGSSAPSTRMKGQSFGRSRMISIAPLVVADDLGVVRDRAVPADVVAGPSSTTWSPWRIRQRPRRTMWCSSPAWRGRQRGRRRRDALDDRHVARVAAVDVLDPAELA